MSSMDTLDEALTAFQDTLTTEQKERFFSQTNEPDATAVLTFTAQLDEENARHNRPCISSRVNNFLDSVQQFTGVVNTLASYHPDPAALIWSSIRFTLLAATNISSYFEKITMIMMDLRHHCPRFSKYQGLFAHSSGLQAALCKYYALVINLCRQVLEVAHKSTTSHIISTLWKPFEIEFASIQASLQKQCSEVEKEVQLAAHQAAERERRHQEAERKSMKLFRREEKLFREEKARSRAEKRIQASRIQKQNLLDKLSSHNYTTALKQARKRRWGQTCSWFAKSDQFQTWWHDKRSSVLWCYGKMGCGKTILSGYVVDVVLRERIHESAIAFFFCDPNTASSLMAINILGSLIKQLQHPETMSDTFAKQLARILKHDTLDFFETGTLLLHALSSTPATLIIDGIDECTSEERDKVFAALQDILKKRSPATKLFLASRPEMTTDMNRHFKNYYKAPALTRDTKDAIRSYIDGALQERLNDRRLIVGELTVLHEIREGLLKGADGMFLWVSFQIEEICRQKTDRDIRRALQNLPKDLPDTYERALYRIVDDGSTEMAAKEFRWIAVAFRTLSVEELREAIAIEPGQISRPTDNYINDSRELIARCAGLLCLDEEEQTVQFVHYSVQLFLQSLPRAAPLQRFHFNLTDAEIAIGHACVTYLNFNDFKRQVIRAPKTMSLDPGQMLKVSLRAGLNANISKRWSDIGRMVMPRANQKKSLIEGLQDVGLPDRFSYEKLQNSYTFLAYASKNWLRHTRNLSEEHERVWHQWKLILLGEVGVGELPWTTEEWQTRNSQVLHWIAGQTHMALLRLIAVSDDGRRTALQAATGEGHANVVERLLAAKADVNAAPAEYEGRTALQAAAEGGHADVVERLLAAKADVNAASAEYDGRTALEATAGRGHTGIAQLLEDRLVKDRNV